MKSSGIGGQAVLEGVMMKNKSEYAVAVRKADGTICVTKNKCSSITEKYKFLRIPFIRGIIIFFESFVLGMKTMTYSSSIYEEEEEKKEQDKKETFINILLFIIAMVLAIAFFVILPLILSEMFRGIVHSNKICAVIEGVIRIVFFIGYIAAISLMKDIKRVFMYHGAEHKAINCVEKGLELNVPNVRLQSRENPRCGTGFLLLVLFVSILFFVFIQVDYLPLRIIVRIILIPVIAGISFEIMMLTAYSSNGLVRTIMKPGMQLQKLTTREPDDDMIEVAIASINAVFDWKAYQEKNRRKKSRKKSEVTSNKKNEQLKEKVLADKEDNDSLSKQTADTVKSEAKENVVDKVNPEAKENVAEINVNESDSVNSEINENESDSVNSEVNVNDSEFINNELSDQEVNPEDKSLSEKDKPVARTKKSSKSKRKSDAMKKNSTSDKKYAEKKNVKDVSKEEKNEDNSLKKTDTEKNHETALNKDDKAAKTSRNYSKHYSGKKKSAKSRRKYKEEIEEQTKQRRLERERLIRESEEADEQMNRLLEQIEKREAQAGIKSADQIEKDNQKMIHNLDHFLFSKDEDNNTGDK